MSVLDQLNTLLNPPANPDLTAVFQHQANTLPTLWLLGKTGAGKSTLIQTITHDAQIAIGNGFQPCTQTARTYDYPQDKPLMRFLDTRGLAEADYDAREDIAACQDRSHALLIVMKVDDPEQSAVIKALKQVKKSGKIRQYLVVHTACELISDAEERRQAVRYNQDQVEAILGKPQQQVSVDFIGLGSPATPIGVQELRQILAALLPILALAQPEMQHKDLEQQNFAQLKQEIVWYASAAAATDAVPAVGLVAVPAVQAKMLHSLANRYGVTWNKKALSDFITALGASFSVHYASHLGIRQLAKLIPVYGQTVGAASAAALSFTTTYALGRVACKYLYHQLRGESVNTAELSAVYQQALTAIVEVAKREN